MQLIESKLDYRTTWYLPDVYLFTGNPVRKTNGAIVMGRGAAKEVRDTYPGIDLVYGNMIQNKPNAHLLWATPGNHKDQWLGWFKVKHHWNNFANLNLIEESTKQLSNLAASHTDMTFHINYPGIGNGALTEHEVGHIIHFLPNNVRVYR